MIYIRSIVLLSFSLLYLSTTRKLTVGLLLLHELVFNPDLMSHCTFQKHLFFRNRQFSPEAIILFVPLHSYSNNHDTNDPLSSKNNRRLYLNNNKTIKTYTKLLVITKIEYTIRRLGNLQPLAWNLQTITWHKAIRKVSDSFV